MTTPVPTAYGTFDFGLSGEQEQRARRLHDEALIIDLMYWGPNSYAEFDAGMEAVLDELYGHHHDRMQGIFDAFWLPARHSATGSFKAFRRSWDESGVDAGHYPLQIGSEDWLLRFATNLTMALDAHPWLHKVRRASDFRHAKADGGHAYFLQCQPIIPISRDLSLLQRAYELGLNMLQLTYNNQDAVGAGCTERTNAGLSYFGVEVVRRCNELGIIIDTGHCGRQTTLDACSFSQTPVVASHTTAEAVYFHQRGKSDEELHAIAETGGVIGVVTVPFFLGEGPAVTIEAMLDSIDHIAQTVGWQHVAIGTDWPMTGPKSSLKRLQEAAADLGFRPEHGITASQNLVGFDDYRDFVNITRGLVARGYTDEQIKGILGENAYRVFAAVLGE